MRQNTFEPGAARAIFLNFHAAVDGEEPHAELVGARDIALLLDRVAKGDSSAVAPAASTISIRRGRRYRSWSRAQRGASGSPAPDCLHRVEYPCVGQRLGEGEIVFADNLKVDDQARAFLASSLEEFADTFSQFFVSFIPVPSPG